MGNSAINIFKSVLDDSDNILKDIRNAVFEELDLGKYEQLNEFVKESLEHFSFNINESNFFKQIIDVVCEEMDHIGTVDYNLWADNLASQLKKIGQVDFSFDDDFRNLAKNINDKFPLIASDDWYARLNSKKEQIINEINKCNQNIVETLIKLTPKLASELQALENKAKSNLDDNKALQQPTQKKNEQQTLSPQQTEQVLANQEKKIKDDLVQQIINAMNKAGEMMWGDIDINERINQMNNIKNRLYNKSVNDLQTLLSTYQTEKKENVSTQDSVKSSNTAEVHRTEFVSQVHPSSTDIQTEKSQKEEKTVQNINNELIDNFTARCIEKLDELDLMFKNASAGKSEIAKGYRTLKSFVDSLNDKALVQNIIDRYAKLNGAAQGVIYDNIIFENVPMLREIFEKYQNLLNEDNIRKSNEPEPKTPNPVETYVGATNEDVEKLIKQNKYYRLLQSIKKEDVMKYNGFIYTGYSLLVNDWHARAIACKTYEEQRNAYFELYEIYQNFRDYISLEKSNELREQLDIIEKYLRQQASTSLEDGIRYNGSRNDRNQGQRSSAMRR